MNTDRKSSIYIVGAHRLESCCLATHIQTNLGVKAELFEIEALDSTAPPSVLLIDCSHNSYESIRSLILEYTKSYPDCRMTLFNVAHDSAYEGLTEWPNVVGLFNRQSDDKLFIRGMKAILQGQLWLPRRISEQIIKNSRQCTTSRDAQCYSLTHREWDVLIHLAQGRGNKEIASQLNLSDHTIKTHLYRAFKKIGVSSRLQAANWVKDHQHEST